MRFSLLLSLFFSLNLLLVYQTSFFPQGRILGNITISAPISVSASIGDNRVTITGYTSPTSVVELIGHDIDSSVHSDPTGYFIFDKALLPKNPSELCLSSVDNSSRLSTPVCIPAPPPTNYQTDIGPILLAPTLTLDNSSIKPSSTTVASGQSIPGSQVSIHFYQVNTKASVFPPAVQAFSLPSYTVQSDVSGNYSFNLPTAYSSNYRLYSTVIFQNNHSPKSNTLLYHLPSLLWLYITPILFIFTLILFLFLVRLYYLNLRPRYLPALVYNQSCPIDDLSS